MWMIWAAMLAAVGVVGGAIGYVLRNRATLPRTIAAICPWQTLEPADRVTRLEEWLANPDHPPSERAAGLILLGCAWMDRGLPERAARPFQMAYHLDPAYTVALVFAFACMKVNCETAGAALEKAIETWDELRRPVLGRSRRERALLAACRHLETPAGASAMAEALWSLPSVSLRQQILEALTNRPAWAQPLWNARIDRRTRAAVSQSPRLHPAGGMIDSPSSGRCDDPIKRRTS